MGFTFLNDPETAAPSDQIEPDARDFEIMLAAVGGVAGTGYGQGPTGVQSGALVTATGTPDQNVQVAVGVVRIGGRRIAVSAGAVAMSAADGTNPRIDLITVDTAGTKGVTAGTASADPVYPTLPAGKVILAQVFRAANDNTIQTADITDKRVMLDVPPFESVAWYGALGNDSFDNTAAFAAAHDALPAVAPEIGGAIFIPKGRYRFTGTILADVTNVTASVGAAGGPTGTFFYKVSAFNSSGETIAVASAPTSITLSNQKGEIAWTAVTGAIGYKIYRGTSSTDMFFLAFANGQATAAYSDDNTATPKGINTPAAPGLAAAGSGSALTNIQYFYRVTAFNSSGETAASAEANITPTTGQNVTLTITAPANAGGITGYRVFRGTATGQNNQSYVGMTTTTTYVDDGKLADHTGRKFTTNPAGPSNLRNETGSQPHHSGIPETVNTSRYGWLISKQGVHVIGEAGVSASAGGGVGTLLIPNTANMTMIQIGDGTTIQQLGPTLEHLTVEDYSGRTGCTGIAVAATNFGRFINVRIRECDTGFWFYRTPLGTDCAWHDLDSCSITRPQRYAIRTGNAYGIKMNGTDMVMSTAYPAAAGVCTDLANSIFGTNVMIDGGLGLFTPPWGGGGGLNFTNLKTENCKVCVDLDSNGTNFQGIGYSITGGSATSNQTNPTGLIIRSVKVRNARIQNWTFFSTLVNGVIDNGADTLIAASNFATNRGISRDVIYNTVKLDDEMRSATTTLADDTELRVWMEASTKYRLRGVIFFDTVAAADFKYGFAGPASPTLVRIKRTDVTPGSIALEGKPPVTFSKAGTLTTGSGSMRFYVDDAWRILSARASVGTAPTGASILVDVNKNGTTIFTTQSNRPTIAVSTNTDVSGTPDVTTLVAGDYLTVDIDQIGSTIAGADLTVQVWLVSDRDVETAYPTAIPLTGDGTNGGEVIFEAIVHNGSTAGYFTFQWAQNTSDAGNTVVRAGSYIDHVTAS